MNEKTKRSQKKALFFSALAMVLSFTMLLGTTYAWFTDSVVSSGNRIQSGKLQVGLEYRTVGTDGTTFGGWADAANVEDILDPNALYEPGYVSMTLLRVENKGTLALKYQLAMVKEEAERSAINVNGKEFKLSDYLVFKFVKLDGSTAITAEQAKEDTTFTREQALALVGENAPKGLNAQTTVDAVLADSDSPMDYVALVITMPEGVGNDAMYDPDKSEAPQLKLDFKLVATQYAYETDSFDQYYDEKAYNADWNVYQYIKGDIKNGLSAYDKDGDEQNRYAVVTVTGTQSNNVTLRVSECNAPVGLTVQAGTTYKSYDISVVNENGDTPADTYTVKMFIGKDLPADRIKLYHNMEEITEKTYDETTGYVTFTTTTFSPFTAAIGGVAAKVDGKSYGTVAEAFEAAKTAEDKTVTLMAKESALAETLTVNAGEEVIVDLNGCTVESSLATAIDNKGMLTVKDTSAKGTGVVSSVGQLDLSYETSAKHYGLIVSSGTLNIESGVIASDVKLTNSTDFATVYSTGILNMTGGKVSANENRTSGTWNGVASIAIYANGGTFTMSDGEIENIASTGDACALKLNDAEVNITGGSLYNESDNKIDSRPYLSALWLTGNTSGTISGFTVTSKLSSAVARADSYGVRNASSGNVAIEDCVVSVEGTGNYLRAIYMDGTGSLSVKKTALTVKSSECNDCNGIYVEKGTVSEATDTTVNLVSSSVAYGVKTLGSSVVESISGCSITITGKTEVFGCSASGTSAITVGSGNSIQQNTGTGFTAYIFQKASDATITLPEGETIPANVRGHNSWSN